ncbi:MAG: TVP38/TMEM64 family protein [Deltaproteobacteria bacterium]|nr:TVP38/TMEM64 family protein [Deltaproteobacteria bacterium]
MNKTGHTPARTSFIIKALAVIAVSVLAWIYFPYSKPEDVTRLVASAGAAAPAAFIVITVLKPVIFFLPSMGLTIVAGTLFGPVWGTVYVVIGGAGSTAVGFFMTRWLAGDRVRRFMAARERLVRLDERMSRDGFRTTLMLRVFNLPWDMVSYAAGLSSIGFRPFYLASIIAIGPVSAIYVYFGSTVTRAGSFGFFAGLALIFITGALPHVYRRRFRGKAAVKNDE